MTEKRPDDEGFPDPQTRAVVKFCEAASAIDDGDEAALPRLVRSTDSKTLLGALEHYEAARTDSEKLPEDGTFCDWDHAVLLAVRHELSGRGIVPIPEELAPLVEVVDVLRTRH